MASVISPRSQDPVILKDKIKRQFFLIHSALEFLLLLFELSLNHKLQHHTKTEFVTG